MKKLFFISLFCILTFNACKKDEEKNQPNIAEVNINGIKTVFNDLFLNIDNSQVNYIKYEILTQSITEDNIININIILNDPKPGIVSFGFSGVGFKIGSKFYHTTYTGNFTITEVSNSAISGSFSGAFMEDDSEIQISGSFSAKRN